VIVSSYKEPLDVVRNTLTCFANLDYPNKHLYFLDDTRYDLPNQDPKVMQAYRADIDALCEELGIHLFRRCWHGAKAGMINDWLDFTEQKDREGFEFTPASNSPERMKEKYIVVFDADMNPFPRFLQELVARMEENPKLAFIQTPQYYTNFEKNRVARAASMQQTVFYEYICEGKSLKDAMFCCGTNVMFRREALVGVGGFDEHSVTEDFATSLKFHTTGWSSAYSSTVSAFGMGPEDLGAYFKQQFRWALGTCGLFRTVLFRFLRNPFKLSLFKWWEYLLSSTYYFVGLVFLVMALCPTLYLLLNVPSYFARPELYMVFFLPYVTITLSLFFWTLRSRGYKPWDIFTGQLLVAITFPVYIRATISAMLGVRGRFVVTPKGGQMVLPWRAFWPQLGLGLLCFAALVWGGCRMYYEREPVNALAANMFWCAYHAGVLSSVLYFNRVEAEEERT
jgi:cellulose synthase (UDP-forming)